MGKQGIWDPYKTMGISIIIINNCPNCLPSLNFRHQLISRSMVLASFRSYSCIHTQQCPQAHLRIRISRMKIMSHDWN